MVSGNSRSCPAILLKYLITLCYREPMRTLISALAVSFVLASPVHAQVQRLLPANGKLGTLTGQQQPYPLVLINRKVLRMAPGGLIFDENNRTILHGYLPASASVLYVLDPSGDISRIVILTPEELARLEQAGQR